MQMPGTTRWPCIMPGTTSWVCVIQLLILSWAANIIQAWPGQNRCSSCSCEVKRQNRPIRYANCSSRDLTRIPDDLPHGLDELDLSYNQIQVTELSKLNRFEYLKTLSIAYNNISTVPKMIFSNASRMQEIDMEGNPLEIVDEDTFKNLVYLRVIKGLETKNILQNAFEELVALYELRVTLHCLDIPNELFTGLNLNSLHLTLTTAVSLPLNLFLFGSKTLVELEIKGPNIQDLDEDIFKGLSVLRKIALSMPSVHTLPTFLFHKEETNNSMPINLVNVVIDGVKSLPRHIFRKQLSLERIELHGIEDLPSGLFDNAKTLDYLDLSGCDVYSVPPNWFSSLSSLKTLNLSQTSLTSIRSDTFRGLNSLTILDLSNNNLKSIKPSVFQHFRFTLVELKIGGNEITAIRNGVFKDLRSLEKLDLSSNKLSKIDSNIFWDLKKLTDLYMQDNKLVYLPRIMLYSQSDLQGLNLARNNVSELPKELLFQTRSLRFLDMSGNRIGQIPDGFLSNVLFLEELNLYNNPLHCDCDTMFLKESMAELRMFGNCSWPPALIGVTLLNLTTNENCYYTPSLSEITSTSILETSMLFEPTTFVYTTTLLKPEIIQTMFTETSLNMYDDLIGPTESQLYPSDILPTSNSEFYSSMWKTDKIDHGVSVLGLENKLPDLEVRDRDQISDTNLNKLSDLDMKDNDEVNNTFLENQPYDLEARGNDVVNDFDLDNRGPDLKASGNAGVNETGLDTKPFDLETRGNGGVNDTDLDNEPHDLEARGNDVVNDLDLDNRGPDLKARGNAGVNETGLYTKPFDLETRGNGGVNDTDLDIKPPNLEAKRDEFYIDSASIFYVTIAVVGAGCVAGVVIIGVTVGRRQLRSRSFTVTTANDVITTATVTADMDTSGEQMTSGVNTP